jgi:hypothetical protein
VVGTTTKAAIDVKLTTTKVATNCKELCIAQGALCAAYGYLATGTVFKLYNTATAVVSGNSATAEGLCYVMPRDNDPNIAVGACV